MDSFEINKILGALLGTVLVILSLSITAEAIFAPHAPEQPGYAIAVPETPETGEPAAPAEKQPPIAQLLASADVSRGETSAKKCLACHTFNKGGANKVGPNLWDIIGRAVASHAGFNYSDAMTAYGGEWTFDRLNEYLLSPKAAVPGTKMAFVGLPRGNERANVIAYLATLADSPKPLPKADTAAAPAEKPAQQ